MRSIAIFLFLTLVVMSCSKEKIVSLQGEAGQKLVSQYEEYAIFPGESDYKFLERVTIDYNVDATPAKVSIFGNYFNSEPSSKTYGYQYEYDDNRNVVKSFRFGDGVLGKVLDGVYTYNSNNQITSATLYQPNGTPNGTSVLFRDTWAYPSVSSRSLSRRDSNGGLVYTAEFDFDENGNCLTQHVITPSLNISYNMTYDNHPSPGRGVFYDFMNDHGSQSWVLNNRNNLLRESTFNTLSNIIYDSDGYPSVVIVDMVGRKRIYTYTTIGKSR